MLKRWVNHKYWYGNLQCVLLHFIETKCDKKFSWLLQTGLGETFFRKHLNKPIFKMPLKNELKKSKMSVNYKTCKYIYIYLDARSHFSGMTGIRSFRVCDPLWVEEVCLELSKGLLDAPSLSGYSSHSDSLFFFCVSSFPLLGFSLKFWAVGKIIFKLALVQFLLTPFFF